MSDSVFEIVYFIWQHYGIAQSAALNSKKFNFDSFFIISRFYPAFMYYLICPLSLSHLMVNKTSFCLKIPSVPELNYMMVSTLNFNVNSLSAEARSSFEHGCAPLQDLLNTSGTSSSSLLDSMMLIMWDTILHSIPALESTYPLNSVYLDYLITGDWTS